MMACNACNTCNGFNMIDHRDLSGVIKQRKNKDIPNCCMEVSMGKSSMRAALENRVVSHTHWEMILRIKNISAQ